MARRVKCRRERGLGAGVADSSGAATLWYHANTPNRTTAQQVYGTAGRNVAGQTTSVKTLPIPNHYGVDDFPIIGINGWITLGRRVQRTGKR